MSTVSRYVTKASRTLGKMGRQAVDLGRAGLRTAVREGAKLMIEEGRMLRAGKRQLAKEGARLMPDRQTPQRMANELRKTTLQVERAASSGQKGGRNAKSSVRKSARKRTRSAASTAAPSQRRASGQKEASRGGARTRRKTRQQRRKTAKQK